VLAGGVWLVVVCVPEEPVLLLEPLGAGACVVVVGAGAWVWVCVLPVACCTV
jgi:hypothetical protein